MSQRHSADEGQEPAGAGMAAPTALLLDLLEWLATEPRRYTETMEAWRTSCPRLPVWEDAVERGFVCRERSGGEAATVTVTEAGLLFLRKHRGRSTR